MTIFFLFWLLSGLSTLLIVWSPLIKEVRTQHSERVARITLLILICFVMGMVGLAITMYEFLQEDIT
jgi:glucan phosphoethanolaminetransferase (alkaline phosphatase superfamily)